MDDLISKRDAIEAVNDALAEYIPTFKPWQERLPLECALKINGIPPVQPETLASGEGELNVPDIYAGELISRQAATTIPVMPKEHRRYQTNNLDDAYEQGWTDLQECIENLPKVQPKCGHWMIEPTEEPEYCKCSECGYVNLIVEVFALDGYHYCPNCGAKMERNEDGTDL